MKIVFLGPPGAGKGTNAGIVAEKTGVVHVSTGDMFREHFKKETLLGIEAKKYIKQGMLVPDIVVIEMVRKRLNLEDAKDNFLLDGFPRTLEQAEALNKMAGGLDLVLHLSAPRETLIQRLSGRLTCKDCGAVFHVDFFPPKEEGICDTCAGNKLYQRDDDKRDAIEKRLEIYEETTKPLLDFYESQGVLKTVDKVDRAECVSAIVKVLEEI